MSQRTFPDDRWVEQHYPRLLRVAWLLTGERTQAEDLAQETMLMAFESWNRFDGRSSEPTWLYAILLRLHRRRLRSLSRTARRVVRWWQTFGESRSPKDPAMEAEQKQWNECLWANVAQLPTVQQQALVLRYAQGLSFAEIGDAMGSPEETARTRVHYGILALRATHSYSQPLPSRSQRALPCPLTGDVNVLQK